jgi:hypothetical protein
MIEYFAQHSPDGKMPAMVMAEIVSPSLGMSNPTQTPLRVIPAMAFDQGYAAISESVDLLIRTGSVSDAIFTLLFVDHNRWQIWVTFGADGSGIRSTEQVAEKEYLNAVKNNIGLLKSLITCDGLDATGKEYIENLVKLSNQYHFSLVFYRAPINADFFSLSDTKPGKYAVCKKAFDQYIKNITKQNSNVFFKDLSEYSRIASQGNQLYLDTHHLNKTGNTLVLEALSDEIHAALEWSKENHK